MDIKIGKRLHDEDATPEKAARMMRKAVITTSSKIGFRISGMRVRCVIYTTLIILLLSHRLVYGCNDQTVDSVLQG